MLALHRAGLEAHQPICRTLDTLNKDPAPTPKRALLRQASEVGAQCGNSARWDLCGGPPARAVPTATLLTALSELSARGEGDGLHTAGPITVIRCSHSMWRRVC